jgi:hypothetical protein
MEMTVNIWAIVLCGVLHWIIGAFWYSPLLFARPWLRHMKINPDQLGEQQPSPLLYVGALVVGLVLPSSRSLVEKVETNRRQTIVFGTSLSGLNPPTESP